MSKIPKYMKNIRVRVENIRNQLLKDRYNLKVLAIMFRGHSIRFFL